MLPRVSTILNQIRQQHARDHAVDYDLPRIAGGDENVVVQRVATDEGQTILASLLASH